MENVKDDKAELKLLNYCNEERLEEEEEEEEEDPAADDQQRQQQQQSDPDDDVYQCSSCNFNFSNVEEHLKKYHSEPTGDIIEVIEDDAPKHDPAEKDENDEEMEEDDNLAFVVKNECNMYECNECLRIFKGLKRYLNHVKTHDNFSTNNLAALEQCATAMKRGQSKKEDFCIETKDENGDNLFRCLICNVEFSTKKQILLHTSMHKNEDVAKSKWSDTAESLDCQFCNKSFHTDLEFELHMQAHEEAQKNEPVKEKTPATGQKKKGVHTCRFCDKEFKRPHEKVKHERVHTGEKPYECELCGKKFRVTYCLLLHKRSVHSDDRPYVCTFEGCKKRFKAQSVYNHHLNTHSDEKKYQCPFCSKSFKTSVQLIGHKKTHLKPHKCTICKRSFSALYAVKNHMATHQNENSSLKMTCNICGAQYGRAFALKDHMRLDHPGSVGDEEIGESFIIIENEIEMNNDADDSELYSVVMDENEAILGE